MTDKRSAAPASEFPAARRNLTWSLDIRVTNLGAERKMLEKAEAELADKQAHVDRLRESVAKIAADVDQMRDELEALGGPLDGE